jgi:hypothetical protein
MSICWTHPLLYRSRWMTLIVIGSTILARCTVIVRHALIIKATTIRRRLIIPPILRSWPVVTIITPPAGAGLPNPGRGL